MDLGELLEIVEVEETRPEELPGETPVEEPVTQPAEVEHETVGSGARSNGRGPISSQRFRRLLLSAE